MNGQLSFQIGDKVVYPNHGVGIIEQISSRTIGPTTQKFYLLKIKASSLKVEVPFNNVNSVGLHAVHELLLGLAPRGEQHAPYQK